MRKARKAKTDVVAIKINVLIISSHTTATKTRCVRGQIAKPVIFAPGIKGTTIVPKGITTTCLRRLLILRLPNTKRIPRAVLLCVAAVITQNALDFFAEEINYLRKKLEFVLGQIVRRAISVLVKVIMIIVTITTMP